MLYSIFNPGMGSEPTLKEKILMSYRSFNESISLNLYEHAKRKNAQSQIRHLL